MLVPSGNYLQRISKRDLCRIEFPSRVYKDTKQIDVLTGELWSVDRLVVNADHRDRCGACCDRTSISMMQIEMPSSQTSKPAR